MNLRTLRYQVVRYASMKYSTTKETVFFLASKRGGNTCASSCHVYQLRLDNTRANFVNSCVVKKDKITAINSRNDSGNVTALLQRTLYRETSKFSYVSTVSSLYFAYPIKRVYKLRKRGFPFIFPR